MVDLHSGQIMVGNSGQNVIAERYWRTIFDNARALLLSSILPESFWVTAVITVVYTRNCVLTSAIKDDKTPYEIYFGKQPSVRHVKVFACLRISKIESHQHKLLPKGQKAVSTGYDGSSPAYISYDFLKKNIYGSRNVTFHEEQVRDLNNGPRPACVLFFSGQ